MGNAAVSVARKVVRGKRKLQTAERAGLWGAVLWLLTYATTMLDRVDKTFERHEAHTTQIISAHQEEVRAVIEQWKQDRAMIIDLLKDGKIDNPSAYHGSSALRRAATELANRMEPHE